MKKAVQFLHAMQVKRKRLSSTELLDVWKLIEDTNRATCIKGRKRILYRSLIAAASLLLLVGITYFLLTKHRNENLLFRMAQSMKPATELTDVQLILSNSECISIKKEKTDIHYDKTGNIHINNKKLEQKSETAKNESKSTETSLHPAINQLIVPKGRRSTLTFSDNTVLWINSGSRVVYPEHFGEKYREIYIDGEAYLQVSHDSTRPFIVKTKKLDVKVLGTKFNLTAYEDEDRQQVVLVDGSVEISANNTKLASLSPNDLFRYEDGQVVVKNTDVSDYIAWIDGCYKFHEEQLSVILDRLSRYYGEEIAYSTSIKSIRCSGKLDLKETLEQVFEVLQSAAPIRYEKHRQGYLITYKAK
jgi:hypothetical protein